MKKQISNHAKIGKLIRDYIKNNFKDSKFSVKSEFNCIRVNLIDFKPEQKSDIKEYCEQYEAGKFNGMDDIYEYKPYCSDLTVDYIFIDNSYSNEVESKLKDYCSNNFDHFNNLHAYEKERFINALFCGRADLQEFTQEFWSTIIE